MRVGLRWDRGFVNRIWFMEQAELLQAVDQQRASDIAKAQLSGEREFPRLRQFFGSAPKIPVAMGLVFLPWIGVVLYTAGLWAALHVLAYALTVIAIGYGLIAAALPAPARAQVILLSPALGVLSISAFTAFWVRLGMPLIWAPALWLVPMLFGAACLWRDRTAWTHSVVAYGFGLALLSVLICAVCFYPSASTDMMQRQDGSFNWKYIDTQQFYSIAESIKDGATPPRTPGTVTVELLYHFGPYAPAAAISRLDGLDLGDAVARVTRGTSLWALLLSTYAVGMLLSLKATGTKFGAIMSVAGFFFYGPLLLMVPFDGPRFSSGSNLIGSLFFKTPNEHMLPMGIPYDHLLSGHSVLHGMCAITAIMGLCLADKARDCALTWRGLALVLLPALAVPVNSLVSAYCFGVVAILLFWGRLREKGSWLAIAIAVLLFFAAWKLMGYGHSPDAPLVLKHHATAQWWMLLMWFLTVLGFRMVGFRWISWPIFKEPISVLVLASVLGWLAIALLLNLVDGAERYGMYFLQSIFSILAFSRVPSRWWNRAEFVDLIADWLKVAIRVLVFLVPCGFLIGLGAHVTHTKTGIGYFSAKLILALLLLVLFAGMWKLMKRSRRFSLAASAVLMATLAAGFLVWSPDWVRYARGMIHTDITYPPGEVRGLRQVGRLMSPGEVFATNKHDVNATWDGRGRSYGYSALSGRPVLLEGYLSRGENILPWFSALLHDNDLLFNTKDPNTLRETARKWNVRFLVARPGTDIALPRPLPPWLVEQQDCGTLKVYRINWTAGGLQAKLSAEAH